MKTFTTIFAAAAIATIGISGAVQADELMDIIHPESADLFDHSDGYTSSEQTGIVSLNDNSGERVWSFEYEQYVNPEDFRKTDYADINQYMEDNPTAAGSRSESVFKWNETAGEYQLN